MSPDLVNGLMELVGSAFTWMNCYRVIKDGGYAGIWVPGVGFFLSWGLWNMWYYPHLGQWWSTAGGAVMVSANIAWIGLMLWKGRLDRRPSAAIESSLAQQREVA